MSRIGALRMAVKSCRISLGVNGISGIGSSSRAGFDAVWVAAIDREEGRSHGVRLCIGGFAAVSGNGLAH
jgi:hypothetical protein